MINGTKRNDTFKRLHEIETSYSKAKGLEEQPLNIYKLVKAIHDLLEHLDFVAKQYLSLPKGKATAINLETFGEKALQKIRKKLPSDIQNAIYGASKTLDAIEQDRLQLENIRKEVADALTASKGLPSDSLKAVVSALEQAQNDKKILSAFFVFLHYVGLAEYNFQTSKGIDSRKKALALAKALRVDTGTARPKIDKELLYWQFLGLTTGAEPLEPWAALEFIREQHNAQAKGHKFRDAEGVLKQLHIFQTALKKTMIKQGLPVECFKGILPGNPA